MSAIQETQAAYVEALNNYAHELTAQTWENVLEARDNYYAARKVEPYQMPDLLDALLPTVCEACGTRIHIMPGELPFCNTMDDTECAAFAEREEC